MQSIVRRLAVVAALVAALAASTTPGVGAAEQRKIDINTASIAELTTLPGIGEAKAKAIVEHRAAAPFKAVEDLKKVKGIGDRTFETLRPSLTVGGGDTAAAAE